MYLAVSAFGPRWGELRGMMTLSDGSKLPEGTPIDMRAELSEEDFGRLVKWIEENDPSLDEIDQRSDQAVQLMPVLSNFQP